MARSADGQLAKTGKIAVDGEGHVYVADYGNNRVQKFDSKGDFLAKWGNRGNGHFIGPVDIALDGQGNVYVVEADSNRVQKFDNTGQFLSTRP